MSRLIRVPLVALALTPFALLLPAAADAGSTEYQVDPVHSQVGFKVRHLVAKVPGEFDTFEGTVTLDPENVAASLQIEATIQTASVNTNNEKRNNHLRSADFFDAENYPEITFQSTSVKKGKGDVYHVTGDLTMRGVTKSVTLEVEYLGAATHPFSGAPIAGLDITGTVNRQDFGIQWNKALDNGGYLLSDDVEIEVHLEAAGATM